jgi:hypothetical protein
MDASPASPSPQAAALTQRHRPLFFVGSNGLYLILVSIFPFLLPYVLHDEAAFSRLMVFINALLLLQEGLNLGLGRGLGQLAIQTPSADLNQTLRAPLAGAIAVLLAQCIIATALLATAWLLRPGWFDNSMIIALWLWLATLFGIARYATQSLLYGTQRFGWFVGLDLAWAAARLMLVPCGWWLGGVPGALGAIAMLFIGTTLPGFALLGARGIRPAGSLWNGLAALRYYWRFGFWLQLTTLAGTTLRPAVVLVLAALLGKSHAAPGFAHLALSLFILVTVSMDALFMGLYPEKAAAGRAGNARLLRTHADREARALAYLLTPLAWLAAALAPWAALWLPLKFHPVGGWLFVIAFALPARGMAQAFIIAMQAGHQPRRGAQWQWLRLACVLLMLMVCYLLLPAYPLAPMWGVVVGEWLVTLLLLNARRAPDGLWRSAFAPALFAFASSAALVIALTQMPARFAVPALGGLWLVLLPILKFIGWQDVKSLLRPPPASPTAAAD